ncbi:MAG: aminodeoxychorismate/anthranilate synthase component II [Phycisphaerales bacterium]|nr:aminodeoxychorismate/anthranilate synthase component II [Phycisphaerales bacterium]
MLLLIDNYDSFTFNLVQRLGELDRALDLRVVRNDELTVDQIAALAPPPTHLIISPGPCGPREAGVSVELVRRLGGRVPILGVCLGHQCIADAHGLVVRRHTPPVHGKPALIHHVGRGIFASLPSPFEAARYHSLIVDPDSIDTAGWRVSAWTDEPDGQRIVMALERRWPPDQTAAGLGAPLIGVQFHPESYLTPRGHTLLENFLDLRPSAEIAPSARAAR